MDNKKLQQFLTITKELNKVGITPVLMGSLGLEQVTNISWDPRDIDIHVPGDIRGWEAPDEDRIYQWNDILNIMTTLGYRLYDLHEHAFEKDGLTIEFGVSTTLPDFAGVNINELTKIKTKNITYLLPTKDQFLRIYEASSKDSYRNDNNNFKDIKKIEYLK